jgi:hypothetical protein
MQLCKTHDPILDESEICDHIDETREDNEQARHLPEVAKDLYKNGPLLFIMRDLATELTAKTMKAAGVQQQHLEPDADNLEAAELMGRMAGISHLVTEQLAAEGLTWCHLLAGDWRNGWAADPGSVDALERAMLRLANRRLITECLSPGATYPALPKQLAGMEQRNRDLQQQRFKERGEHTTLRHTRGAQRNGLDQGRVTKALTAATKKTRARELSKEFPGKKGEDLAYAIQAAWREKWPAEDPPAARSIYRYLEQ